MKIKMKRNGYFYNYILKYYSYWLYNNTLSMHHIYEQLIGILMLAVILITVCCLTLFMVYSSLYLIYINNPNAFINTDITQYILRTTRFDFIEQRSIIDSLLRISGFLSLLFIAAVVIFNLPTIMKFLFINLFEKPNHFISNKLRNIQIEFTDN